MFKSLGSYAIGALALFGSPVYAQEACTSYVVSSGDTLRLISEHYYGTRDLSSIIYSANVGIIGDNPNSIAIGMDLSIPCREGMYVEQAPAFLSLADSSFNTEPSNVSGNTIPNFLAVAGDSPFITQNGSGILPSILATALKRGGYEEALTISRPETTGEAFMLAALSNARLAFPIIKPNCDNTAILSPESLSLCEKFTFSDPLFQITLGVFVLTESDLKEARTPHALNDMRFCIPRFYNDDLLRAFSISSQEVTIAPSLEACFSELQAGTFDAVVADYMSFEALEKAGVVDIPAFATQTTLHAAAHSENPIAQDALKIANTGLRLMLASGEWFEIVEAQMPQRNN